MFDFYGKISFRISHHTINEIQEACPNIDSKHAYLSKLVKFTIIHIFQMKFDTDINVRIRYHCNFTKYFDILGKPNEV